MKRFFHLGTHLKCAGSVTFILLGLNGLLSGQSVPDVEVARMLYVRNLDPRAIQELLRVHKIRENYFFLTK